MGTSASYHFILTHFPPHTYHWTPYTPSSIAPSSIPPSPNTPSLFLDLSTSTLAQQHTTHPTSPLQHQLHTFLFRKQHSTCIVPIYDIIVTQTPSVTTYLPNCMNDQESHKGLTIMMERVTYRLADIGVVRFGEMVYVLEQCLKGLQALLEHFGKPYLIDEDTICFNSQGHCKIWINENLTKNKPNIDATFTQQTIIKQLFETLQSRLDSQAPEGYYRLKAKSSVERFGEALGFVQKIRRKMGVAVGCVESLRVEMNLTDIGRTDSDKEQGTTEAGSLKAIRQSSNRVKVASSQQKRSTPKYSLKNSRNHPNPHRNPPTRNPPVPATTFTKPPLTSTQQPQEQLPSPPTTEISLLQFQKLHSNYQQQLDISRFLRSTYKSVNSNNRHHTKKSIQFTEYSEKVKKKGSPVKGSGDGDRSSVKVGEGWKGECNGSGVVGRKGPLFM